MRHVNATTVKINNPDGETFQTKSHANTSRSHYAKGNTKRGHKTARSKPKHAENWLLIDAKPTHTLMNSQTQQRATQTIAILQNNLRKSRSNTDSILNAESSEKYAILLLQEQYFSAYTNSSLTHQSWTLIESKCMENKPPRAAIYVNKTILPAHSYEPILMEVPDTVAIAIRLNKEQHPTLIINIYNSKKTTQITDLRTQLRKHLRNNTYNGIIIAGDFNLHHPLWNPPERGDYDTEADILIEAMSQLQLKPMLPPGTITYPRAKTAIDLVWGNEYVEQRLIKCRIAQCDHGSDHRPIETILNLQPCPYGPEAQQPLQLPQNKLENL